MIATLAKRAAHRCSNPDCRAITTGPGEAPSGTVNVGEAAHIYGAHVGSARYDPKMESTARSDIANAIWLCGNCHKQIDDDEAGFPPGLLFEWVKQHELEIGNMVGKAGAEARRRYEDRLLEEYGRLSYRAERLLLEKADLWEYRLTEEVLRFEMAPVIQRWHALQRGLYVKPIVQIAKAEFLDWTQLRIEEILRIVAAFSELMNLEFKRSWGERGMAGDDREIIATARLFAEMCRSALEWEETVRFAAVDDIFSEVLALNVGVAGALIDEAAKVPAFMSATFSEEEPSGEHTLSIVLQVPDGWGERMTQACARAEATFAAQLRTNR